MIKSAWAQGDLCFSHSEMGVMLQSFLKATPNESSDPQSIGCVGELPKMFGL